MPKLPLFLNFCIFFSAFSQRSEVLSFTEMLDAVHIGQGRCTYSLDLI